MRLKKRLNACAFGLLVLGWSGIPRAGMAAPFIPATGSQVLERLPSRNDPAQRELQQLRSALAADPANVQSAVRLTQRYVELWRDGGDPRYLGYAQAALATWWTQPAPPTAARVMRASLLQSTHRFVEALADLDAVVKSDPGNAQAWLTRATILQVLGHYAQARASCAHLARLAPLLVAQTCQSGVESLSGHALAARRDLADALKNAGEVSADIRIWVLTLLAEIDERRGDAVLARTEFDQAIRLGVPDSYLLAAYSDFLLMQGEPGKVVALLKEKTAVDALLLRYALALKAAGSPDAVAANDMLAQRFDAARMRGDTIHQREQARFELEVAGRPDVALKVAQQNWATQKEPADTRLLLQAAVAAHDRQAARPVLDWLAATGLEDHALAPLIKQLGQPVQP